MVIALKSAGGGAAEGRHALRDVRAVQSPRRRRHHCTDAIVNAKIVRASSCTRDPNPHVDGGGAGRS